MNDDGRKTGITNNAPNYGAQGNFYGSVTFVSQNGEERITVDRTKATRLTLSNRPITTTGIMLIAGIALLVCVFGLFLTWPGFEGYFLSPFRVLLWLFGMIISMLVFMFGLFLNRMRFLRILWFNFEAGTQNGVYLTSISGTCPRCQAKMRLNSIGKDEQKTLKIICGRNPFKHQWDFDHTVLPDIQE